MTTTRTTQTNSDRQQVASNKPTPRQMRYLRELAMQRGESFTTPRTKAQASAEIQRLKARRPTPHADARRELRQVADDMATRRGDDAQVQLDYETRGYGSSATWASSASPAGGDAENAATRTPATRPAVELGRYTTSADGERIVRVQRIRGVVRLTDVPADPRGRRYLIERGLTSRAELDAVVADYLEQAAALDAIPAARMALDEETA
jgi:hypothetical protein